MFKVDQIGAKQRKVHLLSAFPVAGHLISLLSSLYLYFHFIIWGIIYCSKSFATNSWAPVDFSRI